MEINPKATKAGLFGALAIAGTLIISAEGYSNHAHPDPVGNAEICYGHKGNISTASETTCLHLLKKDADHANAVIDRLVKVPITQSQRAALVDFIYNIGESSFARSTLLKMLNTHDYVGAAKQFTECKLNSKKTKVTGYGCGWAGGKQLNGLIYRRQIEEKVFNG